MALSDQVISQSAGVLFATVEPEYAKPDGTSIPG